MNRTLLLAAVFSASACGGTVVTNLSYPACSAGAGAEECVDRLPVASGLSMPFYRNLSLTAPNPAVTQGIIVVQGSGRQAGGGDYYTVETASEQEGRSETTLVIAPHFECSDDSPPSGDLTWSCESGTWAHGLADTSGAVSSFSVIDLFVSRLADKATFPNLTRVVVTGMGAGGQLAQRYAATNQIDPVAGTSLSYVVVAPSSYAYLDAERLPAGATCSEQGACTAPFAPFAGASSCPGFDQYAYGLEGRGGYVGLPSAADVATRYAARDVSITVGAEDILATSAGTGLDTSCEANAQGVDRLARAVTFWNRVHAAAYGADHGLFVVPGCMHSLSCMIYSPELRGLLFP